MKRKAEIRELLKLSPEEVKEKAGEKLIVFKTLDELHRDFAERIASEIENNNRKFIPTRIILPVGPTGQYPLLTEIVEERNISMENCFFFFMDEYCDDNGHVLGIEHPLSFKGVMEKFLKKFEKNGLKRENVFFPDQFNIQNLKFIIEEKGGIDTCYAGLGITGHLAFNEPEPEIENSEPRLVYLHPATITINAIRAKAGGNIAGFPRKAYTLGMRQILGAKRIFIYCRNDIPGIDWANTVLRVALFGEPGDDFPVTYIRGKNYIICTTEDTLRSPENIL
jgi:glucosamine-6-phosphate deaminase